MERQPLRYWPFWATVGWVLVGVVIYMSLIPEPPALPELLGWDKLNHLGAYALLMGWFAQLYRTRHAHGYLAIAFILLGVALEFLQRETGYRTLDVADMAANSLGVLLAWGLAGSRLALLLAALERKWLPAA